MCVLNWKVRRWWCECTGMKMRLRLRLYADAKHTHTHTHTSIHTKDNCIETTNAKEKLKLPPCSRRGTGRRGRPRSFWSRRCYVNGFRMSNVDKREEVLNHRPRKWVREKRWVRERRKDGERWREIKKEQKKEKETVISSSRSWSPSLVKRLSSCRKWRSS